MKKLFTLLVLFTVFSVTAQRKADHLYMEGTVMGYSHDLEGLFKKEKIEIQGSIAGVSLTAKDNKNGVVKAKSENGGTFSMHLPVGTIFTMTYSKSGYGTSCIKIDLTNLPENLVASGAVLQNVELLLNDNETDKPIDNGIAFATIYYDGASEEFKTKFTSFSKKEQLFKDESDNAPVNLIRNSVAKNKGNNKNALNLENATITEENSEENSTYTHHNSTNNTGNEMTEGIATAPKKLVVLPSSKLTDVNAWKSLTPEDIDSRAQEISAAWDQLEQDKLIAVTEEDFVLIQAREELLLAAEKELEAAKAYIDEQDGKLAAQRSFMWALVGLVLLLGGFVFILIRSIKEKKRSHFELEKRNKKITASINYAERIQRSVLPNDEEIKAILPKSFVFYRPLDVVSGDFYWFSEVNGKVVMAAVDCTGHGVPGAFMSLIGNTLMNQIVKEKQVTSPAEILKKLHHGIVESLNQKSDEAAAQDGMDISICVLDKAKREIAFSGAMNPLYLVKDGKVEEVSANLRGIGGIIRPDKPEKVQFEEHTMQLQADTCLYMFSDGYMDQFGGEKNEKFNISRFKSLLLDIQDKSMEEQKSSISEAIDNWKGDFHQIDDMLVIGVKV